MFINFLSLLINPFLTKEFTPILTEINKKIEYTLPIKETNIIKNISGFYGQIGPNPQYYNKKDDYHLFDGNGMIHGIFFEKGNLTYTNHMIRTDKFLFEKRFKRKLPIGLSNIRNKFYPIKFFFLNFLKKIKLFPNFIGTANTAIWNSNNKIYALNERDYPYEINIDFNEKKIDTIKKHTLDKIEYFTAHPKIDNETIYAISYNTYFPKASLLKYDKNLKLLDLKDIKTNYTSMIHDIAISENHIIFCQIPYKFNLSQILYNKLPYYFDKNDKNIFTVISKDFKTSFNVDVNLNESFFIFHYGNCWEDDENIYFYAIIQNNFEMELFSNMKKSKIENNAKYRKFIINKKTHLLEIKKDINFEKINVEFPICKFNITLLSIFGDNLDIIGFTITDNYSLFRKIYLNNKKVYGEPNLIYINEEIYIICYVYDKFYNNYLYLQNIKTNKSIEIKLDVQLNKGFHSIFIET